MGREIKDKYTLFQNQGLVLTIVFGLAVVAVYIYFWYAGPVTKTSANGSSYNGLIGDETAGGCNTHYLEKFGIDLDDVSIEGWECSWTPDERYGVVDDEFTATIRDLENNEYILFYKKGCCHRHSYPGFTMCIASKERTQFFEDVKSAICGRINYGIAGSSFEYAQGYDQTANDRCIDGEFEKETDYGIVLSLKNDHASGASSPIETVFIDTVDCLDI